MLKKLRTKTFTTDVVLSFLAINTSITLTENTLKIYLAILVVYSPCIIGWSNLLRKLN